MTTDTKIIRNEAPLQIPPQLAAWIGLNEAIFIQQLYYWLSNDKVKGHVVEGVKWIRNTLPEWQENFPFWDEGTIKRTIANLEEDELILSCSFKGRSKWYTIDFNKVETISGPVPRLLGKANKRREAREKRPKKEEVSVQNVPIPEHQNGANSGAISTNSSDSISTKCTDVSVQNVPLQRILSETNKTPNGVGDKKPPSDQRKRDGPRWELMNEFISLTGISLPTDKPSEKYWWSQIGIIYGVVKQDAKTGKNLMREAFNRLGRENVYDPGSLVKTIRQAMAAKTSKPKVSLK